MKINPIGHLVKTNPIKANQSQSKPILEAMIVNFCTTWYYESKQKGSRKTTTGGIHNIQGIRKR